MDRGIGRQHARVAFAHRIGRFTSMKGQKFWVRSILGLILCAGCGLELRAIGCLQNSSHLPRTLFTRRRLIRRRGRGRRLFCWRCRRRCWRRRRRVLHRRGLNGMTGVLIVAPLLLTWSARDGRRWPPRRVLAVSALGGVLVVVTEIYVNGVRTMNAAIEYNEAMASVLGAFEQIRTDSTRLAFENAQSPDGGTDVNAG